VIQRLDKGTIFPSCKLVERRSSADNGRETPFFLLPPQSDHSLFDVEYYRDLKMWLRVHSRPLKVVPFGSLGTVSYSPSIVTMAVSLTISEIFCVKECLTLKSGFGVVKGH